MAPEEIQKQARMFEHQSEWREAERAWRLIGRSEDANACAMIAESTEKGDEYRQRVRDEAGEEPIVTENPKMWVKWYERMNSIYNEMFLNIPRVRS